MKNLHSFLTAIFIICSLQPLRAIDVSGTISTDSVWDISGSPYVITSSLTISHGATLTIQSGVSVLLNDNQSINLFGTLTANGVVFGSSNSSPDPGAWGSINVGNAYSAPDSGKLNLTDCQINYAQYLNVNNGVATLVNTNLSNFQYDGVRVNGYKAFFNMTGGSINTNSSQALSNYCGISTNPASHVTLSGVSIQHYQIGINLRENAKVEINSITISSCNWPIQYESSADLTVLGSNVFTDNSNVAVHAYVYSISDTITFPTINIPYFFSNGITVEPTGRMIIGSNNILKFNGGTSLTVHGSISANATAGEYIYFTSYKDDNWGGDTNNDGSISAPAIGNWYGIRFQDDSNDAGSLLNRCKVRFAGASNIGGISMFNASPTISNCELSNNYIGAYMQYASNPTFSNNTIGSSQMTPIAMSFEANPTMTNNVLSFSDNEYDAIGLIGGTLSANAVLKIRSVTNVQNITYLMLDQIVIPSGKSLTINKGIVIKSFSYAHRIIVDGSLQAIGNADSTITFTSAKDDNYGNPGDCNKDGTITSPVTGDWGGIVFDPGSTGNLNFCRFKYASVWNYGFATCSTTEYVNETAIALIDASPSITNSEFKDLKFGISCYRASNPTLTNNSMVNILFTPICISGASNPTFTGISFTNIGWRAIGLLGGNVCQNGTIKKRDLAGFANITYVLLSDMTINSGSYVNVESGLVIKCLNGYYNNTWFYGKSFFVDGGFKIDGISGQPVVFTSVKDDNEGNPFDSNGDGNATTPTGGDWGSIKYRSTSDDAYSIVNYANIKYAGYTDEGGVTFENAGGQLIHSTISNSSNYGIYTNGNSNPSVDSVSIQNCSLDPIAMSLTSNPTLTNISFASNFSQAIKIIEGTLSSNAILAPRNVAGITNIAYVVNQLTISSNAKLTIQPDVVIKFRGDPWYPNYTFITVNGNLIANGTALHKIYFTSFADDSKGGDSNNNGNASSPDNGDWGLGYAPYGVWATHAGGIMFVNNSFSADTVNSMKYCDISYAGTGIRIDNAHATIDNCVVQLAKFHGISVVGSANPDIKNVQFFNITYSPVELSMFSNPTFTNCTALNVGYMALAVIPETYSQSATVPVRDFGGYTNINYLMEGACTINSGTTITIPAGIVFKSAPGIVSGGTNYIHSYNIANGFVVNGRLNIN